MFPQGKFMAVWKRTKESPKYPQDKMTNREANLKDKQIK